MAGALGFAVAIGDAALLEHVLGLDVLGVDERRRAPHAASASGVGADWGDVPLPRDIEGMGGRMWYEAQRA